MGVYGFLLLLEVGEIGGSQRRVWMMSSAVVDFVAVVFREFVVLKYSTSSG